MLHAFNHKGVRRILASRHDDHTNDRNEDAITSMVFSPLTFMRTEDVWTIIRNLLGLNMPDRYQTQTPTTHEIRLWPKGLKAKSSNGVFVSRCEPDVVMRFPMVDLPTLTITCEMKWTWAIHPDDLLREIRREREAVQRDHPHDATLLVALTQAADPIRDADVVNMRWAHVHGVARHLGRASGPSQVQEWGKQISTFLEKAGQVSFGGFTIDPVDLISEWVTGEN
ncbi:hypothetical protein [Komagataeibacter europaeus]|uniref:hypothetical protein n=1 Tax=Komagataeibacter europaeus TaxID=33995 RepID=UPI000B582C11|nr:hypothetical protein [Komagataeibacter europaeus]ARW15959.1 hypothetical protein S101446_00819 [Komagataeibacter europaeus]